MASASLAPIGQQAKPELPNVGDKLLLRVSYHGFIEAVSEHEVSGGQELVEVEVTAIKKVNVSIE